MKTRSAVDYCIMDIELFSLMGLLTVQQDTMSAASLCGHSYIQNESTTGM